ncbi:hypothetical protein, partial [Paenibacillus eucommiae]
SLGLHHPPSQINIWRFHEFPFSSIHKLLDTTPDKGFSPILVMKIITKMLIHLEILALTMKNIVNAHTQFDSGETGCY